MRDRKWHGFLEGGGLYWEHDLWACLCFEENVCVCCFDCGWVATRTCLRHCYSYKAAAAIWFWKWDRWHRGVACPDWMHLRSQSLGWLAWGPSLSSWTWSAILSSNLSHRLCCFLFQFGAAVLARWRPPVSGTQTIAVLLFQNEVLEECSEFFAASWNWPNRMIFKASYGQLWALVDWFRASVHMLTGSSFFDRMQISKALFQTMQIRGQLHSISSDLPSDGDCFVRYLIL